ncbi:MAG: hypothetical protein OEY27_08160, partial [Gammaproteobacteria bacterium]|nr:hypothetical protein [Gammaproteobacteria bacterium]
MALKFLFPSSRLFASCLFAAYWFFTCGAVYSASIVDTGPGSGPDPYSGNVWVFPADGILAGQFSILEGTRITSAEGWFGVSDTGLDFDILIYDQSTSGLPGSVLFSGSAFAPPQSPTGDEMFVFDWFGLSGLNWELPAGTYWIAYQVSDPLNPDLAVMPGPSPNPLIHYAENRSSTSYEWEYADWLNLGVRIEGNPVPLPASIWL